MGPPSEDGGYLVEQLQEDGNITASMGPPSEDGGYELHLAHPALAAPLQWGRRLRTADIWEGSGEKNGGKRFNGAAV